MEFRTQYDELDIISNSGDRYEPTYKLKTDKNGVRDLVKTGQVDCYAMIQSHKDSVDLKLTLQRFANGDTTALNKVNGCYGDFTNMPTTFAELSQRVLDAEDMFNQLPLEVRREFDHSPSEFFAAIGTEKFEKALGINTSKVQDPIVNVAVETPIEGGEA